MSSDLLAKPKSVAPFSVFLAVALLSAAVLGFEIALSRVFATVLRYQFAFLVVSLALCGMGLGGLWANIRPKTSLENAALGWGIAVPVSLALILRGVFQHTPQNYWIAALLVLVPFCFAGAFLSLAFGRFQEQGGRLYAFDLAGAAVAALLSVALMQLVSAIHAALLFGVLGAVAGVMVSSKRAFPAIVCAMLLALLPMDMRLNMWIVPPIPPMPDKDGNTLADRGVTQPLFTEIGDPKSKTQIIDTRWNAFARTDVVKDPDAGPGSYLIYTNGNVPTNMLRWSGQEWQLPGLVSQFPISDWTFKSANLKGADVFSIGPGGGLDALLALRYGAKRFDGAEINPSIVGMMNEPKYAEWNGGIYKDPRVHVRTAEGRDAVRESRGKYRLVFSALTKTATAGQGAALLESFIYTREAFNDYINALDDEGSMAIVGDVPPLLARLTATAVDHFKQQGEKERDAGRHIAIVYDTQQRGPYLWSLLIKKKPFTDAETLEMAQNAAGKNLFAFWIPGRASSDELYPFGSVLSGSLTLDAFIASGRDKTQSVALDLSPCPDDRPFVLDMGTSPLALFQSSPSLSGMLGGSVLATLAIIAFLTFARRRDGESRTSPQGTLLFLLLGIGFMLIEVPLIQKLVLPLGYPTLSLSVILFSLLLGGGGGAFVSQRFEDERLRRHALMCALGVAGLTLVFGFSSDVVSRALLGLPIVPRCVAVALLLLPLGFLLGTPFPSGMRLLAPDQRSVALAWALNGTASVVGSISAAVLAKMFGFTIVLSIGAVIYLCAAGIFAIKGASGATKGT
ncbi:hypothetical protein EON83_05630 [bacterium]|nr:MAG: hypothetical protein EON83_05630 [bacterium]